jgi:hypothetical protein
MKSSNQYARVVGTYEGPTTNAFWFTFKPDGKPSVKVAIGRSLIHGADERLIANRARGQDVIFRLMIWKARELGL